MPTYSAVMSGDSRYTLYMDMSETDVSEANNTSKVHVVLRLGFSGSPPAWNAESVSRWTVWIDGTNGSANNPYNYDFRNYSMLEIARGSYTVTHNADGSKSVTCYAYVTMADGKGSATINQTFVLTTIPRGRVYIRNASTAGPATQGQVYIRAASTEGPATMAKEVWIGDANGVPRRSI